MYWYEWILWIACILISVAGVIVSSVALAITLEVKRNTSTMDVYIRENQLQTDLKKNNKNVVRELTVARDSIAIDNRFDTQMKTKVMEVVSFISKFKLVLNDKIKKILLNLENHIRNENPNLDTIGIELADLIGQIKENLE